MNVLERWCAYVQLGDPALLDALLADEAVFLSPADSTTHLGKAITREYLLAMMLVLNGRTFSYVNSWMNVDSGVLEFQAEVDGLIVDGVHMIWWNPYGQIILFRMMARPLDALNALVAQMAAELQKAG